MPIGPRCILSVCALVRVCVWGIGGDRGISWDDPLLKDCSIFLFIEKDIEIEMLGRI